MGLSILVMGLNNFSKSALEGFGYLLTTVLLFAARAIVS